MDETPDTTYKNIPWLVGGIAVAIPVAAFATTSPDLANLYQLFPIFGVLAWCIMWSHYINSSLVILYGDSVRNKAYKKLSEYAVLALILLHPLLLIYARWRDLGQLPPQSYLNYVAADEKLFVMFGVLGLLTFLSYEFFNRMRQKPAIRRHWRWVSISQMVAMTLVFIHGLALGNIINATWFEYWWVAMGAALIPCFMLILKQDWPQAKA